MFPYASELFMGCCVTQVPREEMDSGVPVEEMSHEPLGFVTGAFRGFQLNWSIVDKEGFAIVAAIRRLEYLIWGGVKIFCDHRNLAYIFSPGLTRSPCLRSPRRDWSTGARS